MKILHQEMELREETRGLEQARPALDIAAFTTQAEQLAQTQQGLAERVADVTQKITALPDAEAAFSREIALLTRVEQVMVEAQELLQRQVTGPADDRSRNGSHRTAAAIPTHQSQRRRWWRIEPRRWRHGRYRRIGLGAGGPG